MGIRVAIPEPTSTDTDYNQRSLPLYVAALEAVGVTAVLVPLSARQDVVARCIAETEGVLLPGSCCDVDPERYGEERQPECGTADPARTAVDELLLQDAFNLRKPILAICHGVQSLNVWRNGTLIQDLKTSVNHRPGREVVEAHPVRIKEGSRLERLLPKGTPLDIQVNSSHHQALREPGDQLRVIAVSPQDGVIEAVELNSADHFVLGVQWHPERTYSQSAESHAIFAEFARALSAWKKPLIGSQVSHGE
jgi:putative glutamine amidotransferase